MFIKNVNLSLKKILAFSIILLFLGSSLFVGTTIGKPSNQVPVDRLELETAEMAVKVDASDNSRMATIDTTKNIIYGDDWSEVVNPDGSRTRSIGIPTYFKDEAYHPVDTNIVPLDDGEYQYGVEEGKYQGEGTFTFSDNRKYIGQWKNGKFHGQGAIVYPDGDTSMGLWTRGHPNGIGTVNFPDGRRYEGQWVNGKPNGQGTLTDPDGTIYIGHFEEGKYHGQGTMIYPDGRIYEGEWVLGRPTERQ